MIKREMKKAVAAFLAAGLALTGSGGCKAVGLAAERKESAAGKVPAATSTSFDREQKAAKKPCTALVGEAGAEKDREEEKEKANKEKDGEKEKTEEEREGQKEKSTGEKAEEKEKANGNSGGEQPQDKNTSFCTAKDYKELLDAVRESRGGFAQWGINHYYAMDFADGMYGGALDAAEQAPDAEESAQPSGSDYSDTNVQVEGIAEADIVKTDGEYIYILSKSGDMSQIFIVRAADGALAIESSFSPETPSERYSGSEEMYVSGNRLVLVRQKTKEPEPIAVPMEEDSYFNHWFGHYEEPQTQILIYDITDRKAPVFLAEHVQDGSYVSSREKDGYLYVISEKGLRYHYYIPYVDRVFVEETDVPEENSGSDAQNSGGDAQKENTVKAGTKENGQDIAEKAAESQAPKDTSEETFSKEEREHTAEFLLAPQKDISGETLSKEDRALLPQVDDDLIPVDSIYFREDSTDSAYTIVTAICLDTPGQLADSVSFMADAGHCYMSGNAIYLAAYDWWSYGEGGYDKTDIVKIAYENGKLRLAAQGEVKGNLDGQFSMDEKDGFLRIVTTVNHYKLVQEESYSWQDYMGTSNSLYVLDTDLRLVGSLEDLAEDELIYSVRFLGDIAYFVTFRNTDPLFSVDVSDPAHPVLLGALKIPGFSDYLHPYGEDLLLGVGYNAGETGGLDCVKLTMFDISDPRNVVEKHTMLLEDYSASEACANHKAVLVDEAHNLIGLPLEGYFYPEGNYCDYAERKAYAVYGYDEEKGFYQRFAQEYTKKWEERQYYDLEPVVEEIDVPEEIPQETDGAGTGEVGTAGKEESAGEAMPEAETAIHDWNDWYSMRLRGIYIGDYFYLVNPVQEVRSWRMGQESFLEAAVLELE